MRYSNNDKRPLSWYKRLMADKYPPMVIIPWWKMPVYRSYQRDEYIVAPVGFHVIFRLACNLWMWFRMIGWDAQRYLESQLKERGITKRK